MLSVNEYFARPFATLRVEPVWLVSCRAAMLPPLECPAAMQSCQSGVVAGRGMPRSVSGTRYRTAAGPAAASCGASPSLLGRRLNRSAMMGSSFLRR
jgi:hypothetical protein